MFLYYDYLGDVFTKQHRFARSEFCIRISIGWYILIALKIENNSTNSKRSRPFRHTDITDRSVILYERDDSGDQYPVLRDIMSAQTRKIAKVGIYVKKYSRKTI